MIGDKYEVSILPLFENDLNEAVDYISVKLKNPEAARKFIDSVEKAIEKRTCCAEAFEPYESYRERTYPYYRIYVGNYIIFYTVTGNIMEVRRLIYDRRHMKKQL